MSQTIMIGANDPNTAYLLQRYAEESGFQPIPVFQSNDILAAADRLQAHAHHLGYRTCPYNCLGSGASIAHRPRHA